MVQFNPGPDFSSKLNKIVNYVKRTNTGGFLFYSCENTAWLFQINRAIIERAREKDIDIQEFFLTLDDTGNFLPGIRKIAGYKPGAIMISNIDETIVYTDGQIINDINGSRDILLGLKIPILFGMSAENISRFANQAQDLFLRRDRGVIYFTGLAFIAEMEEAAAAQKAMKKPKPVTPANVRLKIELLERQLKEAEEIKDKPGRIANDVALELIKVYLKSASITKAKKLFKKYKLYFNLEDHLKSIEGVAEFYNKTSQWHKALELLFKSKKMHQDMGDKIGLSRILPDIATAYYKEGRISESLEYYRETEGLLKSINDPKRLASTLNTIGNIEYERGRWDKALENYLKSKEIFVETGDEINRKLADDNIRTIKEKLEEKKKLFLYNERLTRKIIKISKITAAGPGTFKVNVLFPSGNSYDVTLRDPFSIPGDIETDREERLRWYFEEHLRSPYTDREKARRAAESVVYYGESLFAQIFSDVNALAEWRGLANGQDKVRVQVFSEACEFQALHWEALKDPEEAAACCLKGVEFVRTSPAITPNLEVQPCSYLNVLMVTARPGGKDDVDYRTITRPVVETVEKNKMRVRIHLLRPPTFRHLKEHLREKKGFYHIIHFDVHGDVLSFEEYQEMIVKSKAVLSGGRREVTPYEGTQAFILLVGEEGGADLVQAKDVAELLRDAHAPLCFLNACRSGMATLKIGDADKGGFSLDASLALKFLERGVRLVVGMAWSLTVTAARIMMTRLYDLLARGEEPGAAMSLARQALHEEGCRFEGTDCRVVLEDWLLPVLWGKSDFGFKLELGKEDQLIFLHQEMIRLRELEGVKTEGIYGFLGRDLDILVIEEMLMKKNILLVKGMGGTGKTTLLGHMAEWWLTTGWLDHVFYFCYDRKPYRGEEILNTIAGTVMPRDEFGSFLVLPGLETKAIGLAEFLKAGKGTPRVLLILDSIESITVTWQAMGSHLEMEEQKQLIDVLKLLMRSSMMILLGSRADEEWLGEHTFKNNIYVLEGLDHVSRFDLAGRILGDRPLAEADWEEFQRLMEILAGYPLAMEIILPNLANRGAKEMREAMTGAGIDLHGGKVSEEIFKCINISFSLLTEKARHSILVIAPFTSFLNASLLEDYLKELQVSGSFSHLTPKDLEEAIVQGEKQGLLKTIAPKLYSIQPVYPFFLDEQAVHLLDAPARAALEQGFYRYMSVLAKVYNGLMESKDAKERQMGFFLFKQDRENLYKALHRVLDSEGDFYRIYLVFAQFYHRHPLNNEAIEFTEGVVKKLDSYSKKDREFLGKYGTVFGNLGSNYMEMKEFSKAKDNLNKALRLLQQADDLKEIAVAYRQLGMVAIEERDLEEAKQNFREALQITQEFNDRYSQASIYHQLGMVAQEQRDWEEAKRYYREALKITQEFNDRYSQASIYYQLGVVAQDERDLEEAKQDYREALKIFQEFNDRYRQGAAYLQLGIVAQEERDWEEAKRIYRESLRIYQEFNDRYNQAGVYHHLGMAAQEERDWEEAKRNYQEALRIKQEYNDRYSQAGSYHQLGRVAEEEADYDVSLAHYVTALEIFSEYNDKHSLGIVTRNLSRLLAVESWDAARAIETLETGEETKKVLREMLEKIKKEPTDDKGNGMMNDE